MATIGDFVDKTKTEGLPDIEEQLNEQEQQEPEVVQSRGIDLSFLQSKTGPGPIDDYIEHPLNFNGSRSVAQMLRGFTGMMGALDYALVDIGMGLLNFTKERKRKAVLPIE